MTRSGEAYKGSATFSRESGSDRKPSSPLVRCDPPSRKDDCDARLRRGCLRRRRLGASRAGDHPDSGHAGRARRRATLEVPALWPLEVANALTVLVRRRKLNEDERQTGLGWLRGLPLRIDPEAASLAFSRLSELVAAHRLSVYDAAYLELAQRRKLALACTDGPLRKTAKQAGVSLWE